MKNLLLALVATLMGACAASANPSKDPAQYAFDYACEALARDCSGMVTPEITWDNLRLMYGIEGTVNGGGIVVLDITLSPGVLNGTPESNPQEWSVLVHEMTHAIDIQMGLAPNQITDEETNLRVCQSEARAFFVANRFVLDFGREDLLRLDWLNHYPRCQGVHF